MTSFEIRRLFSSRLFYASIVISTVLGLIGLFFYNESTQWHIAAGKPEAVSAYDAWLYCLGVAPGSLLKVIFPLMIAIPFCDSYLRDQKSGYINFVVTRGNYTTYLLSKYLTCGIAGSLIMGITLLLLLVVCFAFYPVNLPNTQVNLNPGGVFGGYYNNQPNLYIIAILALNVVFGFAYSILGLSASAILKNRFAVTAFPFLFYLALLIFSQLFKLKPLFPLGLIAPFETGNTGAAEYIAGYTLVTTIIFIFSYKLFKKPGENVFDL